MRKQKLKNYLKNLFWIVVFILAFIGLFWLIPSDAYFSYSKNCLATKVAFSFRTFCVTDLIK